MAGNEAQHEQHVDRDRDVAKSCIHADAIHRELGDEVRPITTGWFSPISPSSSGRPYTATSANW